MGNETIRLMNQARYYIGADAKYLEKFRYLVQRAYLGEEVNCELVKLINDIMKERV